jgi:two-component system response regulator HydG
MPTPLKLLLVDDDPASLHLVERFVETEGFEVVTSSNGEDALKLAEKIIPDLVITDVVLPGMDGFSLLARLREKLPQTEVIVLTGHATVERAVEAIRDGACDYIEKPVQRSRLIASLRKAKQQIALRLENLELRKQLATQARDLMIGESPRILEIRNQIERIAGSNSNVFIDGESGTGKEVAAELIHRLSPRAQHLLVKVSCAAIPDNLLESEMFGYQKGAFTGAHMNKEGKFEVAHKGTLFLDEIGEMSAGLQAKLLRVIQDGQFSRLGHNETRQVDVRIVCATNIDVEKAISKGSFRQDLFYRLNVVHLHMPPLKDRLEDIPLLVQHFLDQERREQGIEGLEITSAALDKLAQHGWPGNVRELSNAVERAVALRKSQRLDAEDFSLGPRPRKTLDGSSPIIFEVGSSLGDIERQVILRTLERCNGDKEKAAAMLGISSRTIYRKIEELDTLP